MTVSSHPFDDPEIMRRLLDDSTVLFAAVDGAGTIRWMCEASAYLLGRPPQELIGTNMLDLLHPEDHDIVLETMGESARGAEDRIRVGLRLRHADGSWVSLEFGGLDLREPDGTGLFLVWGNPNETNGQLVKFMGSLLAGADLDGLMAQVAVWHDTSMPGTHTTILVRDADGGYRNRARSRPLPDALAVGIAPDAVRDEGTPWARSACTGSVATVTDLADLPGDLATVAVDCGYQALWVVPVAGPGEATPAGLIVSWRLRPGPMLATHRRQIDNALQIMRLAIGWSAVQEDLVVAATTDPLTGLANRSQLELRVDEDRSTLSAMLYVDLDDFKVVNDHHGHDVGDRILKEAAQRLIRAVRPDDLLVRLGGDEFAVWCADLDDAGTAEAVAESMIATLAVPIEVDGHAHRIGCSVGVAVLAGADPLSPDLAHVLGTADRALYRAKRAGKGQWVTVDASLT